MMRELNRYWERQQSIEMIYLDRNGDTSRRIVRILELDAAGQRMKAYCYTRGAYRIFAIANILAVAPIHGRTAG
ncbi:WYL domain-containing protein [Brevibacillus choshinensis]|uniref:WYL domain-containing protein n=1 Tax=Brevibacillus choshinensis TaxID=54911 RepID=A0ABX7FJK4_BRECH|nr:WYL domain-containing protein [Brevibacillus choshinensis]QRG66391.1 WYL domain-containing protein [Brevibacillus choshinensis]